MSSLPPRRGAYGFDAPYAPLPMACRCGAADCRRTITGEDWRRPDLQRKYGDHFAWHLLRRMRSEP